jgi:hypothetical protein
VAKLSEVAKKSLVVFVFLACFHAFFYMIDSGINCLDGRYAMSAFVMLGFFQMMLGLLQGFKRSLHVRLIVIIVARDGSDRNAKESKTSLAKPELSIKHESKRTTPFGYRCRHAAICTCDTS